MAIKLVEVFGSTEAELPPGLFAHQLRETTFETLNVGCVACVALLGGVPVGLK